MRPLLLLDVDGVLALQAPAHAGFVMHTVRSSAGNDHDVWLDAAHGLLLRVLGDVFDIRWTTGWEDDAPRLLGPLLSLPDWPAVSFSERPQLDRRLDKLPDVTAVVGDRPVAWVDDDLDARALEWAAERSVPTLTLCPAPVRGLEKRHVLELLAFASEHRDHDQVARQRAAVVVVEDDHLAVIERRREDHTYYVLPGGGVKHDESVVDAAVREAKEETDLTVDVGGVLAVVRVVGERPALQYYLRGGLVSGSIGPGTGPEYDDRDADRGSYRPMWLPLDALAELDVRPRSVVDGVLAVLSTGRDLTALIESPLIVEEALN